jgi:hypothetical protein
VLAITAATLSRSPKVVFISNPFILNPKCGPEMASGGGLNESRPDGIELKVSCGYLTTLCN